MSKLAYGILAVLAALTLAVILSADCSSSDVGGEFTDGALNYRVTEEGDVNTVTVTGFFGWVNENLVIPKTVTDRSVTYDVIAIGPSAFLGKGIKTADLGNVRTVGAAAFSGCIQMTVVKGTYVKDVGIGAFLGCTTLTAFTGENISIVGATAFSGCVLLNSIDLSKASVIGTAAFLECRELRYAQLAAVTVGNRAFYGSGLVSVTIPAQTVMIGGSAFNGCGSLSDITISENNMRYRVDEGALVDVLTHTLVTMPQAVEPPDGKYVISDDIVRIEDGAFDGCTRLNYLTIPGSVKEIGSNVFDKCSNLKKIIVQAGSPFKNSRDCLYSTEGEPSVYFQTKGTEGVCQIPASVTKIESHAYTDCTKITSVDLRNVTEIGSYAFSDCYSMTEMYINKDTKLGLMSLDLGSVNHRVNCVVYSDAANFITIDKSNEFTRFKYKVSVIFEIRNAPSDFEAPENTYVFYNDTLDLTPYKANFTGYPFDVYVNDKLWTKNTVTMGSSQLVISFRFDENGRYTMSFDTDGGPYMAPLTLNEGETIPTIAVPTKAGHTFTEWTPAIPAVMPSENFTVTAGWAADTYTVRFDANGGDSVSPASIEVTYGSVYGTLPTATKTENTFLGWFTSPSGGEEITADSPVTVGAYQTLYAQWSVNMYTVTVHYAGYRTAMADRIYEFASGTHYDIASPTMVGYSPDVEVISGTMGGENMEYTVNYLINQYTITFRTGGGSEVSPITQDYATPVTAPENPSKDRNEFKGWLLNGQKYVLTKMPGENITLDALWLAMISPEDVAADGETRKVSTDSYSARMDWDTVASLRNGETVRISLGGISLILGSEAFGDLTIGGAVTVQALRSIGLTDTDALEKMTAEKRAAAGKTVMIDLTVQCFGSTEGLYGALISIPYALAEDQSADDITVYRITDSGEFVPTDCYYENGILTVITDSLSSFAVSSEPLFEDDDSEDELFTGMPKADMGTVIGAVIGIVAVIGLAVIAKRE